MFPIVNTPLETNQNIDILNIEALVLHGNNIHHSYFDNNCFILNYVYAGNFEIQCAKKKYIMSEGNFLLSKPHTEYTLDNISNNYACIVTLMIDNIHFEAINKALLYQNSMLATFISTKKNDFLATKFTNNNWLQAQALKGLYAPLLEQKSIMEAYSPVYLKLILNQSLLYIESNSANNTDKRYTMVQAIENYIDVNLTTATLSKAAEAFNYTPAYLSDCIRQETGYTFTEILTTKRMSKAIKLLTETDQSIEEIGKQTGYSQPSSFIKVFKNTYHITPNEYRKTTSLLN